MKQTKKLSSRSSIKSENIPHDSSASHVQGKSEFIDDRRLQQGEVYVGIVTSTHAHAEIKSISIQEADQVPGILGIFSAKDFVHNVWGSIIKDQPLLAADNVQYYGEPILLVASESKMALEKAKALVKIKYTPLSPVLSIAEAKKRKNFIGEERKITRGDFQSQLSLATHKLEGSIEIKGQDHFYLESQACIVYPLENDCLEVHSSSQHPTEVQHVVAHALGLADKNVSCIVKRMGGAFGGKESQASPFSAYAALVARRLNRPARITLTKDEDMLITGKRNPFLNEYRVGFSSEGKIQALQVNFYSDAGAYADLSTSIMERAMLHIDNAYFLPSVEITGQVCKTNNHPHTAFRGFGGPKGVATIENILEEIAVILERDPLEIRKLNVYSPENGETTHYGQKLTGNLLPTLFENLERSCDYNARRKEISTFNLTSKTHLRGMALTAVKFGISFTTRFLNQGNALVNVQMDGTIQVSTGATEMGQGVNTRIAQIVAECFGLSSSRIRVLATSTERNHNTSPTAASSGTDINGQAALLAAKKIKSRMAQVAHYVLTNEEKNWASPSNAGLGTVPEFELQENFGESIVSFDQEMVYLAAYPQRKISFALLCRETFLHRISLGDYGFYKYPGIYFNKLSGEGNPFFYFTQGTACSEVEIDRYTGEMKVVRADLLMDLGRPINEALDRGQVAGAFIQGMGWVTTENLHYASTGQLLTCSPSTYKIPNIQDTPRIFNIDLLENNENGKNLAGSKAVGEPPLLLAISVWIAVKNALQGLSKKNPLRMSIPANLDQILLKLEEHGGPIEL